MVTTGGREPEAEPLGRRVGRQGRGGRRAVVEVVGGSLVQLVHGLARQRVGHLDRLLQRPLVRSLDRLHRGQLLLLATGYG